MKTLIIDNYDSFTFNLVQYVGELQGNPVVYRNNAITIEEIKELNPTHIILSPGPGDARDPQYFGICPEVIKTFQDKPLLGVCLGHQGIGASFGAEITNAPEILHGKRSEVVHFGHPLFEGIPSPFIAMRYHSLIIQKESLPEEFDVIAETEKGSHIMGIAHKQLSMYGIQFHPESIGTPAGKKIVENFLKY